MKQRMEAMLFSKQEAIVPEKKKSKEKGGYSAFNIY